jgi:hypothetical protein
VGIELPAELAGIARRVGAHWPEADEDAMQKQADAWREAARGLRSLASEADATAAAAVASMTGEAAEQAARAWSEFVAPDAGLLTGTARAAEQAADRLEHAARQVGAAKVEIIRQLADAARTEEAAAAAADGGHPEALLTVRNLHTAVAANVTAITESLAGAVADTAREVDASPVLDPLTGSRGPGSLLAAVSGVPDVVSGSLDAVDRTADRWTDEATDALDELADFDDGPLGLVRDRVPDVAGQVADVSERAVDVRDRLSDVPASVDEVADRVREAPDRIGDVHDLVAGRVADVLHGREVVDAGERAVPDDVVSRDDAGGGHEPSHGVEPGGGDVPTPPMGNQVPAWMSAPTPPMGFTAPHPHQGPPGQTSLAGFVEGVSAPGPPLVPPAGGPPQPAGGFGSAPVTGLGGPPLAAPGAAPPAGGYPGVVGGTPGQPGQQPHPAQPPGRPPGGGARAADGNVANRPAPPPAGWQGPITGRPVAPNVPATGLKSGVVQPQPEPHPRPGPPQEQPAYGTPRKDRASIVALFRVHMFPLGHLPVASSKPSRQLPPRRHDPDEFLSRFPPYDHPRSSVFDDAEVLPERAVPSPGLPWDHPALTALFERYDPLAGMDSDEWQRRYLVADREPPEYAWPPAEACPEGCHEPGEAVMLGEGTVIDRFGTPRGRVFHPGGTAYRLRSLPPPGPDTRYRRYRVLRPMPVWRGTVAPWFGQPGGAERLRAVYPADDLVVLGYLREITDELTGDDTGQATGAGAAGQAGDRVEASGAASEAAAADTGAGGGSGQAPAEQTEGTR